MDQTDSLAYRLALVGVKSKLSSKNTRENVIIDGKLYIPRKQWEVYIRPDGTKGIMFSYVDLGNGYHHGPRASVGYWKVDPVSKMKEYGKILDIKGSYKMDKKKLDSIIWKSIILEGYED